MQRRIEIASPLEESSLLGVLNSHAKAIDDAFHIHTGVDDAGLLLEGDELAVSQAEAVWLRLREVYRREGQISEQQLSYFIALAQDEEASGTAIPGAEVFCVSAKGRPIRAKTRGQERYARAMEKNELVFAIGPAGTGKTFLAVAMAVKALRSHQVSRIILTRPAVEAGEKLGFLPGDLQSKVDPYMRPLYDALYELMGMEQFQRQLEKGAIEISPLAYMRGRTLDDAFIILDEAQNTTPEQMKMFLTRIGYHSRTVVTGDVTQIDLPRDQKSGLLHIDRILDQVEGIAFIRLEALDVVRNSLVQKIIAAYERHAQAHPPRPAAEKHTGHGKWAPGSRTRGLRGRLW